MTGAVPCPDCDHAGRCPEGCVCNCDAAVAEYEAAALREALAEARKGYRPSGHSVQNFGGRFTKRMVCCECLMEIVSAIKQAQRHGWVLWVGGARCKSCEEKRGQ